MVTANLNIDKLNLFIKLQHYMAYIRSLIRD